MQTLIFENLLPTTQFKGEIIYQPTNYLHDFRFKMLHFPY